MSGHDGEHEPGPEPGDAGPGTPHDPDEAWRAIVEHYGDRPVLEGPEPEPRAAAYDREVAERTAWEELDEAERLRRHAEEHFVPPEPPPVPRPRGWRAAAWAGLVLAPVLLVLLGILHLYVNPFFDILLVAWFVGGFVYLVATMRKDADDGWDDGAVV